MRFTTFLTALAGLGSVTATHVQTDGAKNPAPTLLQPGGGTLLFWDPVTAYEHRPKRKARWERTCDEALAKIGCDFGIIHPGISTGAKPDGQRATYIKVEGAAQGSEGGRKMRVFEDGSTQDGWSARDQRSIAREKRRILNAKKTGTLSPAEGHTALLSWEPANAWHKHPKTRAYWEKSCSEALTKAGCSAGIIHQGQSRITSLNGKHGTYVNVEGASLIDMENLRKMRVFHDGSYQDGWSVFDWISMAKAKKTGAQHTEGESPLLFWEPANAYKMDRKRKVYWEHKCGEALARNGCGVGLLHVGEVALNKPNGANTSYLNVVGAPLMHMENAKRMRVFFDGTSQDGWSARDHNMVAMAAARRAAWKESTEARQRLIKKTGPQQPAEPQRAILSWNPADAYDKQRMRKLVWEKRCHEALVRESCDIGMIHLGESSMMKPNGEKMFYVRVEGKSATNTNHTRQMRVFLDGTSENVDGWSERDRTLMAKRQSSTKRQKTQRYTMNPKNRISWDPPNAYEKKQKLRKSFETACDKAFEREGCNLGIIHQGLHKVTNDDGTSTRYMTVSAGNQNNPEDTRYMQLLEDGTYHWYPSGQLPPRVVRRVGLKLMSNQNKRPERPEKEKNTSPLPQAQGTEAAHSRLLNGGEYPYAETQLPPQGHSREIF